MRKIDKQPRYTRLEFPGSYRISLILDAADAAAMLEILARNPVFNAIEGPDRYDTRKRRFAPTEEGFQVEIIEAARVDWPTPSLAYAVQAARKGEA